MAVELSGMRENIGACIYGAPEKVEAADCFRSWFTHIHLDFWKLNTTEVKWKIVILLKTIKYIFFKK